MKKDMNRTAVEAALAGTAMVLSTSAAPLLALAATPAATPAADAPEAAVTLQAETVTSTVVQVPQVQGEFAYSQAEVTPTADIRKSFLGTDAFLCGGEAATTEPVPIDQWSITVGGDVAQQFTATLSDLADDNALTVNMGCACAGNGADQRVSANAEVTGVTLLDIMRQAGVAADANTITFTSADGYEVSLPLSYVKQRYSLIVFDVNGDPLQSSMGGTNQLWLGSTAAKYFARDITGITFEARDAADVPAAPGTPEAGDAYANVPNVAVLTSKEA